MKNIIKQSLIFRLLTAVANWLDGQWRRSLLSRALTGSERVRDGGFLGRVGRGIHTALCSVFRFSRLDRLTEGSVLTRDFFWVGLAVFFAPILPTMAVLALTLAAVCSVIVCFGRDRERRAVYAPVRKWILAFAAVFAVSSLFPLVRDGLNIRSTLLTLVFTLFPLALIDVCSSRRRVKTLIGLIVASGALVAAYGVSQVLTGAESSDTWVDSRLFGYISIRVYSTLDNPNVLSEYLLLVLPLGAAATATAKTANGKIAAGSATALMAVCMVLTWSRAGWVGLILSCAVFLVLCDRRFLLPGLAAMALLTALLPGLMLDRLASIGSAADSSAYYRMSIWSGVLDMLKDYWLFGVGSGAFEYVYPRYSMAAAIAQHAHSLYLQIMCDSGIPGIVTFLGVLLSSVRSMGGALSRGADRERRILIIAVISSLAGFLLQCAAEYGFYNYRVMLMFWIEIGLAAALSDDSMEERP